jgi:hypothetical protein
MIPNARRRDAVRSVRAQGWRGGCGADGSARRVGVAAARRRERAQGWRGGCAQTGVNSARPPARQRAGTSAGRYDCNSWARRVLGSMFRRCGRGALHRRACRIAVRIAPNTFAPAGTTGGESGRAPSSAVDEGARPRPVGRRSLMGCVRQRGVRGRAMIRSGGNRQDRSTGDPSGMARPRRGCVNAPVETWAMMSTLAAALVCTGLVRRSVRRGERAQIGMACGCGQSGNTNRPRPSVTGRNVRWTD